MNTDTDLSEIATLKAEIEQLKLAEEGASEAYGVLVQEKRDLETKVKRLEVLLNSAYESIRKNTKPNVIFN